MRFAVLADLHIGRSIPLAIAEYRREAFEKALTKVVDAIVSAGVDYVFICGDLFERRTLRPHMVEFTQRELFRLVKETEVKHKRSIRILVIRGNHDGRSQSDALDYIRHPLAGYLHVFGDEDITYDDERLHVVGLNYYDQIDVAYERLAKPALSKGKGVKVLMLHGFVANYNDVPPGDSSLNLDQLAASGADYVFTGHYHKKCEPRKLNNNGWVATPGSTEVYDFAEEPEKGFYIVDTEGPKWTWVPIEPLHVMKQVKIGNGRGADSKWYEAEAVKSLRGFVSELQAKDKQGYIRIKLEGTLSEGWPSDVSEDRIREAIPDPLLLWVDVDTLELNLPPSVARPMAENTDVAEYFGDFACFAKDIREVHGRVREALEEEASTKTGLLTATQREQFITDWVHRFEVLTFKGGEGLIESLTLRGFKSYRGQQTIRFSKGVNKISGRNASGKTTILEAVLFGLFGEVPGVEKRDLLPVGGGDLFVELIFRTPKGVKVTVHREASLVKKGTEEAFKSTQFKMLVGEENETIARERDAQDRLRELLGISSGTFFNVVYARQKEFVDILNPEKGRMNAILGLTAPSEIREQLREVRKQLEQRGELPLKPAFEERIRNAEKTVTESGAQLTEITSRKTALLSELHVKRFELQNAKDATERIETYATNFDELDAIQQKYELNRKLREKKEDELEGVASEMGESPDIRLRELETRAKTAKATEDRLRHLSDAEVEQLRRAAAATVDRLTHQIKEHKELRDRGVTVCPKCGQPIDPAAIEKDLAQWVDELEIARKQVASAVSEIQELRIQAKTASDRHVEAEKALDRFLNLRASLDKGKRDMLRLDEEGAALNERIELGSEGIQERFEKEFGLAKSLEEARKRIDEKVKTLRLVENRLSGEVSDRSARFQEADAVEKKLKAQLAGVEQTLKESRERLGKIAEYEAKIRALDGVVERYGAYERDLRDNTLRLLEYMTFEYFRRLTDQQLYSSCKIDRERYTLEVQPKGSPRSLPAWRAGGGHQSLFALAERLALLRVRNFPYLLILDEPTDAVDSENIPHLLEYIARGSREIGQVLLVTHHGQGEEEGVNIIRVQKVDGESKVTQELAYG